MDSIDREAPTVRARAFNRNTLLFAVKFVLSVGLVGYLVWKLDFHLPPINGSTVFLLFASVVLLVAQPALIGARWRRLLAAFGVPLSLSLAIRITWISVFANQFLPASVGGDVVRVVMGRARGLNLGGAIMSIFFDRGFALLSLFILIMLLSPFLVDAEQRQIALFAVGGLAVLGAVALVLIFVMASSLQRWLASRPSMAHWSRLVESSRLLVSDPMTLAVVLAQSLAVHVASFGAIVLIAYAFGVQVAPMSLIALGGLITLAHVLPISIAGWGVRDAASVVLLGTAGVDSSTALSISLLLGAGYAVASLPGAFLWLFGTTAE